MKAFKLIVNDPDSVLDCLTREIKEVGPDGQEVLFVKRQFVFIFFIWLSE